MVLSPALASQASGGGSDPEIPWVPGTKWAIGTEVDLFEDYGPALSEVEREMRNQSMGEVRDIDLGLTGVIGFYHQGEVLPTDSTDLISVTSESAIYFHSRIDVALEARLPKAGTYDGDEFFAMEWIEMEYQQSSNLVLRALTTQYYTDDTFELARVEAEIMIGWREAVRGENLPYFDYDFIEDGSDDPITLKYKDMTAKASASITCGFTTVYEPALNVFDFPLKPNESWTDTSTATVSGYLYGDLDISRPPILSQGEEEYMFEGLNEGFEEMGLTKRVYEWDDLFPLHVPSSWMVPTDMDPEEQEDWEELSENVTIVEDRFVFGPVTNDPATYHFSTGDQIYVPLPDGELVPALGYNVDEGVMGARGYEEEDEEEAEMPFSQYVSLDDGRTMKLAMEVPDVEGGEPQVYDVMPVTNSHATAQMNAKADFASPAKGGYPLTSEDDPFPWLLVVAICVAVVVVGLSGRFMLHQRREKRDQASSAPLADTQLQQPHGHQPGVVPGYQPAGYGDPYQQQLQQQQLMQQQYGNVQQYQPPPPPPPPADPYAAYRNTQAAPAPTPSQPTPPPTAAPPTTVVACPACGGHFQIPAGTSIIACPHCGTQGQMGT